jgi:hypothetical protein
MRWSYLSRMSALTVMQHVLYESLIYNEMWVKKRSDKILAARC